MNEREMLELAAKADGREVWFDHQGRCCEMGYSAEWNPLTDDGDALLLAVKLGMRLSAYSNCVIVDTDYGLFDESADLSDIYAATRLAITRAAAEIGRSM